MSEENKEGFKSFSKESLDNFSKKITDFIKNKEGNIPSKAKDGEALENVPETMRNSELYLAAVQQNGEALMFVPETMRNSELCMIAAQQDLMNSVGDDVVRGWCIQNPEKAEVMMLDVSQASEAEAGTTVVSFLAKISRLPVEDQKSAMDDVVEAYTEKTSAKPSM